MVHYFVYSEDIERSLAILLEKEGLTYSFHTSNYPIILSIRPGKDTASQIGLFAEEGASSADAEMRFIFLLEGISIRTDNRLIMSDQFMTKVKNLAKNLHYAYLQAYFAATKFCDEGHDEGGDSHGKSEEVLLAEA